MILAFTMAEAKPFATEWTTDVSDEVRVRGATYSDMDESEPKDTFYW